LVSLVGLVVSGSGNHPDRHGRFRRCSQSKRQVKLILSIKSNNKSKLKLMIEYPYLSYPRDEEEKEKEKIESENEEMIFIVNDDFFKFKKEFSENDDKDIYKEDVKSRDTNQTEIEENLTNTLSLNKSLNSFIEYTEKYGKINKRGRKKKTEKNQFQCLIGNKINEHNNHPEYFFLLVIAHLK